MIKVIGVIQWSGETIQKLKVIVKNGEKIIKHTVNHDGKKVDVKRVIDIVEKEMKLKKADINIPKHIEIGLKEKE